MIISSSPHIKSDDDLQKIMWRVNIALIPALAASIYFFGFRALLIVLTGVISACLAEYVCGLVLKKEQTLFDGSAVLTGILLSFNLPPSIPLWMVCLGSFVAIGIAKMAFGGLGCNIFNPALVGRAFLLACYPVQMTTWHLPRAFQSVTSATPLAVVKEGLTDTLPSCLDMFLGNHGGCIGETSALMLIIGGLYLLYKKVITWHIPVSFIGTVAVLYLLFGGEQFLRGDMLFGMLTGGVMLGAIYMATDMVTSPITKKGQLIFGCGIGLLTCLIRFKGGYPEGVSYSILIMNSVVPIIERYVK